MIIVNEDGGFSWDNETFDGIDPGGDGVEVVADASGVTVEIDPTVGGWDDGVPDSPAPSVPAVNWVTDDSTSRDGNAVAGFLRWVSEKVYNLTGQANVKIKTATVSGPRG